jgi:LPS-assembly lipoprotein
MRLWRIVLVAGVVAVTALGSGCGFELRRAPTLPFSTLQLKGFKDSSPLGRELRRSLVASRATVVVDTAGSAQVVLEALADEREKSVVASTAAGQVREVQLRARLLFRVRSPAGKDLLPTTEILLSRDMSYNESNALAKEHEEGLLYAAMQSDIVAQVLRRLAAVPAL